MGFQKIVQEKGEKGMNYFIEAQISTMISMTKTFQQSCQMAAKKDDGKIDKTEEKQIKKINAAADRFIGELQKIKDI